MNFLPKNLCLFATLCSTGTRNVLIIKTETLSKIIAICYAKQHDLVGFLRRNGRSGGIIRRSLTGEPHNTIRSPDTPGTQLPIQQVPTSGGNPGTERRSFEPIVGG